MIVKGKIVLFVRNGLIDSAVSPIKNIQYIDLELIFIFIY